jgi:hypothetical protein
LLALSWELDRGSRVVPAAYERSDTDLFDLAVRHRGRLRSLAAAPVDAVLHEIKPELG